MKTQVKKAAVLLGIGVMALGCSTAMAGGTYDGVAGTSWVWANGHSITGNAGNASYFGGAGGDGIVYMSEAHSAGMIGTSSSSSSGPITIYSPDIAQLEVSAHTTKTTDWVWVPDNNNSPAPWIQPQYLYRSLNSLHADASTPAPPDPSNPTAIAGSTLVWSNDRGDWIYHGAQAIDNQSVSIQPTIGISYNFGPYYRDMFQTSMSVHVGSSSPMLGTETRVHGAAANSDQTINCRVDVALLNASDECPAGASCEGSGGEWP